MAVYETLVTNGQTALFETRSILPENSGNNSFSSRKQNVAIILFIFRFVKHTILPFYHNKHFIELVPRAHINGTAAERISAWVPK